MNGPKAGFFGLLLFLSCFLALPALAQDCQLLSCGVSPCCPPATGRSGDSVSFNGYYEATGDCPRNDYYWDFGDGSPAEHDFGPGHSYVSPGVYTWTWTVNYAGQTCSKVGQITITPGYSCTVTTAQTPDQWGVQVQFSLAFENSPNPPSFYWEFGDGGYSSQQNPQHHYSGTGPWTWKVTSYSGSQTCVKTGKIVTGNCLSVGSLVLCAEHLARDDENHVYTFSGNAKANSSLYFGSDVVFAGDPGTGRGTLTTAGPVFVKLGSHNETLYAGPGLTFALEGSTLMPSFGDSETTYAATLAGMPLFAAGRPIEVGENTVTVKPTLYIGTLGLFTLASLEASILYTNGGDKQLTSIQLVNGQITPSIQFMTIQGTYDPELDKFEGSVSVSFPFLGTWSASAAIRIQAGCFNGFDISVGLPAGIPLGTTGLEITGFTLKVDNICNPPQFYIFFGGDLGIVGVPGEIFVISQAGYGYQSPHHLRIQAGSANFLGYPLASLGGTVSAVPGHAGVTVQGSANLAGIYQAKLDLALSVSKLFMGGAASGTLQVPDFTCSWVNVPCRVMKRALTSVTTLPHTLQGVDMEVGLSGRTGSWNGGMRGMVTVGSYTVATQLEYRQGEELSLLVGTDYADLYQIHRGEKVALAPEASEQAVTLATAQPLVLFAVAGDGAVPSAYVRTPGGQTVTPANVGTFSGMSYVPGDEATKVALFRVENAAAGTWTVGADNLSAGQATFAALAPVTPPQATFTSVQKSGDSVGISLAVAPSSASTKVGLFFSTDGAALAGDPITLDLPAASGSVTATWDTTGLASGTYFLFARVEDGMNPAAVVRHPQPVAVTHGNLSAPTGLAGTKAGTRANLSWVPSSSPSAAGYNIRYTDTPEVPGTRESVASVLPDRSSVEGLDADETYRFTVQAFDAQGNFSPESAPLTLEPAPAIPGDCDGSGTISIGEVQKAINMFLGTLAPACGVDCNGNGTVSIGEVQKVINGFLGNPTSC